MAWTTVDPKGRFPEEDAMAVADLEQARETEEPEAQAPRWETVECTCPDPCCERDHEQD